MMSPLEITEGTGEELIEALTEHPEDRYRLIKLPDEREFQTYEENLKQAVARTPDEIAAARARVFAASQPPREMPPGKSLEDMILGQWPGDETDEQIFEALEKLS